VVTEINRSLKSASRAGVHDDYHYESIVATVDPKLIRTEQRLKAASTASTDLTCVLHRRPWRTAGSW